MYETSANGNRAPATSGERIELYREIARRRADLEWEALLNDVYYSIYIYNINKLKTRSGVARESEERALHRIGIKRLVSSESELLKIVYMYYSDLNYKSWGAAHTHSSFKMTGDWESTITDDSEVLSLYLYIIILDLSRVYMPRIKIVREVSYKFHQRSELYTIWILRRLCEYLAYRCLLFI